MDRDEKCHAIIHSASAATAGVAAATAQIPLADTVPITGIQIGMIISIGEVFDEELTKSSAGALLGGFAASTGGRAISQALVGWIPGFGNAINATTAAGITEAIGWAAVAYFEDKEEERELEYNSGRKSGERDVKKKFEALLKEIENDDLKVVLKLAIAKYTLTDENIYLKRKNRELFPLDRLKQAIAPILDEIEIYISLSEIEAIILDIDDFNALEFSDIFIDELKEYKDKGLDNDKLNEIVDLFVKFLTPEQKEELRLRRTKDIEYKRLDFFNL